MPRPNLRLVLNRVHLGNNIVLLKSLEDDSVDAVVTDPPYGLGTREPTLEDIIRYLMGESLDTGGDFMGKPWEIPTVAHWRECYRVLKPGGHLLSFAGTRTLDLISIGIRVAGFESRDTIADFYGGILTWVHGQGFPKSLNIYKALKKAGYAEEICERWKGWGTALKPSWEPILVFRKPMAQKTIAEQIIATATGGLDIDDSRVKHASAADFEKHKDMVDRIKAKGGSMANSWKNSSDLSGASDVSTAGRWPSNVVLCHHPDCKRVGTKTEQAPVINRFDDGMKPFGEGAGHPYTSTGGGTEEVPVYECVPGCPVRMLDEQSGDRPSGGGNKNTSNRVTWKSKSVPGGLGQGYGQGTGGDAGGASRFFPSFEGQRVPDAPFFYTGKAAAREKHAGLERKLPWLRLKDDIDEDRAEEIQDVVSCEAARLGFGEIDIHEGVDPECVPKPLREHFEGCDVGGNKHATVKPLALMEWLVRMVCPKGGVVLDPYAGSGTTCVAAVMNEMKFIGMEIDPMFHEIAEKRAGIAVAEHNAKTFQRSIFDDLFAGDDE